MHDVQFEDRLRAALRAEADSLPLSLTADLLQQRLRSRRRRQLTERSLIGMAAAFVLLAVAGAAILLSGRGDGPPVGVTPSPSAAASPSAAPAVVPLATYDELLATAGTNPIVAFQGEQPVADPGGGDRLVAVGAVALEGAYDVIFHCVGSGTLELAWHDGDGSTLTESGPDACPRFPAGFGGELLPDGAVLLVRTSGDVAWRLIAVERSAAPVATPTPQGSLLLLPASEAAAAYPGWDPVGILDSGTANPDGSANLSVARPETARHLLISATCSGTGSLAITATGFVEQEVACPTTADAPERTLTFVDGEPTLDVAVAANGTVGYSVRVEVNEGVLDLPAIALTAHGTTIEMLSGCGVSIALSWGYTAGDSCATTIPAEPIQELVLQPGSPATVELDDWSVVEATARCGRLVSGAGDPDRFEPLPECTVDAAVAGSGARMSGLPAGNRWLVELNLRARNAIGDEFGGPFYAWVTVP